MLWDKKVCIRAAFVIILLFSLIDVATFAMPAEAPFLWITNSSGGPGLTVLEPGNSLAEGNWIVLDGGNTIRIPDTSFEYSGTGITNGSSLNAILSDIPFLNFFGFGTTFDIVNASPHNVNIPYNVSHVYSEANGKNVVSATFYGNQDDYKDKTLTVELLDLTQVTDKIDFTDSTTIKDTAKLLTLDDIKNSRIDSVDLQANDSGDIASIESSIGQLQTGLSQGYYLLMVIDNSDPTVTCIVAETPIIVAKSDMTVDQIKPAPQPGDQLSFTENMPNADPSVKYTYVTALIPEADYNLDLHLTTPASGDVDNSIVGINGFGLSETATINTDGTSDGTTIYLNNLKKTLTKADLNDVSQLKDTLMKEINDSNIALGVMTNPGNTADVNVPTRDIMPKGKYIVLTCVVDRETGRIAAINQTTINLGYVSYSLTYNLKEGWNLISVPLDITDNSVSSFFPVNVVSEMWDLWGWDSSTQTWTYFSPDPASPYQHFNRTTTMDTGKGYWVNMNSSQSFTIQGVTPVGAPNRTIPLMANWNLVGLTGMSPVDPYTLYPTAWDVWRWNANKQSWDYFSSDPNTPYKNFGLIPTIEPGQGVWVNI